MVEPIGSLEWLSEQFATTNQRLAVTVLAVGLLVLVLSSAKSLLRWLHGRIRPLYADVVGAVIVVGTCVLTMGVTIAVWGQTSELRVLWEEYEVGGAALVRLIVSVLLVVLAYIVSRFVQRFIADVLQGAASVTDHQQQVTYRLSQVFIWALALVVVLGIWIDDLGALLVGAGFLGIVLGMAARQTLGSVLSGFVLMFSRPFEIGDWIVIEDVHEGIVTDISIVDTRIRTVDGEYVIVPNDVIGASAVTNRSRMGRLRVEVDVGVDYEADVDRAAAVAVEAVSDLEASLAAPDPFATAKSFGDSSIVLGIRFWITDPTARAVADARTAAIGAIADAFEAEGIKIPYPQRELTGREETGGFRVDVPRGADPASTGEGRGAGRPERSGAAADGSPGPNSTDDSETEPRPEDD